MDTRLWLLGLFAAPRLPPETLQSAERAIAAPGTGHGALTLFGLARELAETKRYKDAAALFYLAGEAFFDLKLFEGTDNAFDAALTQAGLAQLPRTGLLRRWGEMFGARGMWKETEKRFEQALEIDVAENPASLQTAADIDFLGVLAGNRNDPKTALKLFERALAIREKVAPESLAVADSLNHVALAARDAGDRRRYEEHTRRALAIRQKLAPVSAETAASLQNLAVLYHEIGDLQAAERYYRESEQVYSAALSNSDRRVSAVLHSSGILLSERGDLEGAETRLLRALELREKFMPGSLAAAQTMKALGELYVRRSDFESSAVYLKRAEQIVRELVPDTAVHASAIFSFAEVLRIGGQLREAEVQYQRGKEIVVKKNIRTVVSGAGRAGLGRIALARQQWSEAKAHFEHALKVSEAISPQRLDVAKLTAELGAALAGAGDLQAAERAYERAIGITGAVAPSSLAHAEGLHALALLKRERGDSAAATDLFVRALKALDEQSSSVGGSLEIRSAFDAGTQKIYRDYMHLLLQAGRTESAFDVHERSRARVMREMLAQRDLSLELDLGPELDQQRRRLAVRYDRAYMRLQSGASDRKPEELQLELREIARERERLAHKIRTTAPTAASLMYSAESAATQKVSKILAPGTLLLSFSVGPENTVLFIADQTAVSAELCNAGEKRLLDLIDEYRKALLSPYDVKSRSLTRLLARKLYDLLLRPAEPKIAGAKRILIVPDGPLHKLPFASLRRANGSFLIEWKPLHITISATVYGELRRFQKQPGNDPRGVALFGAPLPWSENSAAINNNVVAGKPRLGGYLSRERLPASGREVRAISQLNGAHAKLFTGAAASEEQARKTQSRILHFAVHAFADPERPLDSAIVFSPPTKRASAELNGLLQAWELIEQVRWNADLAVLSACETAAGKTFRGEGVLGLTRAIHHAGVRAVIATLWKVDDARSADLMVQFHRYLNKGIAVDEALRRAQLDMIGSKTGSAPAHWASFVLSGDWRRPDGDGAPRKQR